MYMITIYIILHSRLIVIIFFISILIEKDDLIKMNFFSMFIKISYVMNGIEKMDTHAVKFYKEYQEISKF